MNNEKFEFDQDMVCFATTASIIALSFGIYANISVYLHTRIEFVTTYDALMIVIFFAAIIMITHHIIAETADNWIND